MKKMKIEVLKKQLNSLTGEIGLKEKQISRSLDYGVNAKLKKEITVLKKCQCELIKQLEELWQMKAFIKNRGKLRTVGFRNGNRTVIL